MICYKKFPEPMKIMNISSPLRTLPKLLALLIALTCTPPLIHAKVGEQENWYLAREIRLDNINGNHSEYKEGNQSGNDRIFTVGNWSQLGTNHSSITMHQLDENLTSEKIYTYCDGAPFYVRYFTILPDGQFLLIGHKAIPWDSDQFFESTGYTGQFRYEIGGSASDVLTIGIGKPIMDGFLSGFTILEDGYYWVEVGSIGDKDYIPMTYSGGTIHTNNSQQELFPKIHWGYKGGYNRKFVYHIENPGARLSSPPSLRVDFNQLRALYDQYYDPADPDASPWGSYLEKTPFEAIGELNGALFLDSIYEFNSTGEISTRFSINSGNKILINTGETDDALNFEILQLNLAAESNETTVSLLNELSIAKGSAPGQINTSFSNYLINHDDGIIIKERYGDLKFYASDGSFIKKGQNEFSSYYPADLNQAGQTLCSTGSSNIYILDQSGETETVIYPNVDSWDASYLSLQWTNDGGFSGILKQGDSAANGTESFTFQIWKRAYRTKGLPTHNVIPQPVVRSVTQRPGTNILDIDFEIIDPDDDTATAGLLGTVAIEDGYEDGFYRDLSRNEFNDLTKLIVPSSFTDGTDALIGQPIATNQVHRVSWYVKGDWKELTGDLKVGVFAQDARRSMPVDLHFLKIPTEDGNLTISRSPLKDSDMLNYFQYLLSIGDPRVKFENGKILNSSDESFIENISNDYSSSGIGISKLGRDFFMNDLGYRWASIAELSIAREAATPGTVNEWDATNQVQPRNLPKQINEYGFDTGNHGTRAWWVVKESSLEIPVFTSLVLENDISNGQSFGYVVHVDDNRIFTAQMGETEDYKKIHIFETNNGGNTIELNQTFQPEISTNHFGEGFYKYDSQDEILVIGANSANAGNFQTGEIYLIDLSGDSVQLQSLSASDAAFGDLLGYSVSINDNQLVAGAPGDQSNGLSNAGSAYVFERSTVGEFSEKTILLPEISQEGANFGAAVAIYDNVIAVSADWEDINQNGSNHTGAGAVYIYASDASGNISLIQKIQSPIISWNSNFGNDLSMSDQWLLVGEKGGRPNGAAWDTGSVHLYRINSEGTAELSTSLYSPSPRGSGFFGNSVAIDGDRLVVGAPGEDSDNGSQSGVVYVYQILDDGKVRLLESLIHPTGKANDQFGQSVSISGLNILVGAPGYDLDNDRWNAGSAVLFRASQ